MVAPNGIHSEHVNLLEELDELERGLARLECPSGLLTDLVGASQVEQQGHCLAAWLRQHFRREEEAMFPQAAQVSPELEDFCRLMKAEHADLLVQLSALNGAVEDLEVGESIHDNMLHIKAEGKRFTYRLRHHVAQEEQQFSGFL